MRVELDGEALATPVQLEEVTALLRYFREGRHIWILPPQLLDTVIGYLDHHLAGLAQVYQEHARQAATLQAYATPDTAPHVRISSESISDHLADLEKPAVLVVENDHADKAFVVAVLHAFGGGDLLAAIERGWLIIDHGGGSDLYRRAVDVHRRYCRLVRTAALFDSDRQVPSAPAKNAARIEEVRRSGVLVHVLTLCEAENYLPNNLLRAHKPYSDVARKLDCLKQLTLEQRGYFDMKKGFPDGVRVEQRELFQGVPLRSSKGWPAGSAGT
jgi:hypothetical protein